MKIGSVLCRSLVTVATNKYLQQVDHISEQKVFSGPERNCIGRGPERNFIQWDRSIMLLLFFNETQHENDIELAKLVLIECLRKHKQ